MNKIGLLKKVFLVFVAFFGVITLSSCASANKSDARILVRDSTCTMLTTSEGNKILRVTFAIDNQTIYNINKVQVKYNYVLNDGTTGTSELYTIGEGSEYNPNFVIRYGVSGYLLSEINLDVKAHPELANLKSVELNAEETKVIGFQNLWQTYMGWFIAAIIIFALSFGGFLFAIFSQNINRNNIKEFLSQHISSTLITACFALVICIIPLIFSSWVVTLILLGTFLANIILSILVTLLRANHLEKKKLNSDI